MPSLKRLKYLRKITFGPVTTGGGARLAKRVERSSRGRGVVSMAQNRRKQPGTPEIYPRTGQRAMASGSLKDARSE
jgi:hypothetical protein